jgi:cytochrome c oxidase accessory protein FixG
MNADSGTGYFARHVRVRPRIVHGRFATLRAWALVATLGVLVAVPWLRWGGRPAVLLDLPRRKFFLFGIVLWPQDLIYLTALLVIAALLLFLVTALAGRVWCGYACPQTVFTQILVWLERLFEGDRARQLRLAKSWSFERVWRQSAKGVTGIVVAGAAAVSAVGYFVPIRELLPRLWAGTAAPASYVAIAGFTGAILLFGGRLREQVCVYMCPYARFQSAMFDRDTLIVSYDRERGEPRGPLRRGAESERSAGACVDCNLCAQVCPTGIDIRNGLQYQCIACAGCIDACDGVMDRIGAPRGLVRYTTLDALEHRPTRLARPRVLVYAALIALFTAALGWALAHRIPLELDILRDRSASFREAVDGRIENVYRLRVLNMDPIGHAYSLHAEGPRGVEVLYRAEELYLAPGEIRDLAVRVRVPADELAERSTEIRLVLRSIDEPEIHAAESSRFLGPKRRAPRGATS